MKLGHSGLALNIFLGKSARATWIEFKVVKWQFRWSCILTLLYVWQTAKCKCKFADKECFQII